LKERGINIERSQLHDAAGINDDYPAGRGVFFDEKRNFVILVNMQDHIEIVMVPQSSKGLSQSLL
jgi:galactokinase/mevalonate kinase-like predicted kinase